ncbi:hypothetical protein D3C78_1534780 [compost metagenome]
MLLRRELGQHRMADAVVAAKSDADQDPAQKQAHGGLDIELHHRSQGDQHEADQEDFLSAQGVRYPTEKQAAEE